jgi:predicted Zn-ribbon and HTH transcriptional regulator
MFRKELLELLLDNPTGIHELAHLLEQADRELEENVRHLARSLKHSDYHMVVHPAYCRKCEFRFSGDKLRKPGKCPRCHDTWIAEPLVEIRHNRRK